VKHHIHLHGGLGTEKALVLKLLAERLAERLGYAPGENLMSGSGDGKCTPPIALIASNEPKRTKSCFLSAIDQVKTEWLVVSTGSHADASAACNVELNPMVPLNLGGISAHPSAFAGLPDEVWSLVEEWVDTQRAKCLSEALDDALPTPTAADSHSRM